MDTYSNTPAPRKGERTMTEKEARKEVKEISEATKITAILNRISQAYLLAKNKYTPTVNLSVQEFDTLMFITLDPITAVQKTLMSIVTPARQAAAQSNASTVPSPEKKVEQQTPEKHS